MKNYYVNETLKQVYKIIGSLDFVGNPTILFSSFVSGVRDLPTKAFLKSPTNVKEVGVGLGKGTLSFFSNGASGIFGFSARLWATAGQAVAVLSLDSESRVASRSNCKRSHELESSLEATRRPECARNRPSALCRHRSWNCNGDDRVCDDAV